MKRNLTQSELEMLGLQSGTISTPAPMAENTIKPAVTLRRKVSTDLQPYVGMFVVSADGHYGMVDNIHGDRLGFVHAEKDSWTAEVIDANNVKRLSPTSVDGAKAYRSAQTYFNREATSLRARIKNNHKIDNNEKLNAMLTHCETWLRKIG